MKKIYFALLLLIFGIKSFSQNSTEYFGGIYNCQVYFNWTFQNNDSCYFTIEVSEDSGKTYYEAGRDSVAKVPIPVLHGIKIDTGCDQVWVRLVARTEKQTITFQPQPFQVGKYTSHTKVFVSRIIHADL